MSIFGDAIHSLGSITNQITQIPEHGLQLDFGIQVKGNATHALLDLQDAGIEAWGQTQLGKNGSVMVRDKDAAISVLRSMGWEVW